MEDRRTYLKIKIKSLADEAKIIRKEERKQSGPLNNFLREGLHGHRIGIVREEARLSQLAYGFLRGRSYEQLEHGAKPFNAKRVLSLIEKFGPINAVPGESWNDYQARVRDLKKRAEEWVGRAVFINGQRHLGLMK